MSSLWFDLRYTVRLLARSPGFAALCVLVIALALGLAITIYVLVGNQGLKPLPLPAGERYAAIHIYSKEFKQTMPGDRFGAHLYQSLLKRSQSFELLGAGGIHGNVTLSDGDISEAPYGLAISPELLLATGVVPLLGRNLIVGDALPGADPVAVIGHSLWQSYYGGRRDIIGHGSRIDGELTTIVGVLPQGYSYPLDHHLWKPLRLPANSLPGSEEYHLTPIGILKPGVTQEQASAELKVIMGELGVEFPEAYSHLSAVAVNFIHAATGDDWSTMVAIMLAAAFIILLLACLNVGNLLLVRANERTQELVIRSALGGSRGRIIQQVLLESLLICLLGGGLGIWLGAYGAAFVRYQTEVVIGSAYLPFWMSFEMTGDIILFSALSTLMIWLIAGGIPAWRASQLELNTTLSSGGKGVASKGNGKVARALVASEVVCSFFLLVLSGAFVSAVYLSNQSDFGVSTENRIIGTVVPRDAGYTDEAVMLQYYQKLRQELLDQPAISNAVFTGTLPGMGGARSAYALADRDLKAGGEYPNQIVISIGIDYFQAVDVSLLAGRHFDRGDSEGTLPVAIIEQAFADKIWPGESALGKRILLNPEAEHRNVRKEWVTVVGVVDHIDQRQKIQFYRGLTSLYRPAAQRTGGWAYFVIESTESLALLKRTVQTAAARIDRDVPVHRIQPMEESLVLNTRILKTLSELFVAVAMIALVLAGTGIYGVVSRTVLLRTREMGIRRALGFTDRDTIALFLRQGAVYLLIGMVFGGGSALLAANLLTSEFPDLLDSIFSIVIIITVMMTVLVLGACYLPARKMVAIEPAVALHYE